MSGIEPETPRPSIADAYHDLLAPLDDEHRRNLTRRLAQGYYEGWRPTREELAALIAEDGRRTGGDRPMFRPPARTGPAAAPPPRRSAAAKAGRAATPVGPSGTQTRRRIRSGAGGRVNPQLIAEFKVDCGELLPRIRFVARSMGTSGMVERGSELCRQVYLTYELHPLMGSGELQPAKPVLFTAPIVCFPDRLVPWDDGDGRDRHHSVTGDVVVGRRGPWPLAGDVQRVRFMINRQTPLGIPPHSMPAGTLIVDIRTGRAAWRPA